MTEPPSKKLRSAVVGDSNLPQLDSDSTLDGTEGLFCVITLMFSK